ncbi:unnamed protein product [Cunninghamella blakesleeana]
MSSSSDNRLRDCNGKKQEKSDKFKLLREARQNRSRSSLYTSNLNEDLYDEVDEDEYNNLQDDSNFVEDNDNAGYIDNGQEEEIYSDEYDNDNDNGKRKRKGNNKKQTKAKKDDHPPVSHSQLLDKFFQQPKAEQSAFKSKSTIKSHTTAQDDDFMANLLSNLTPDTSNLPSAPSRKIIKREAHQRMTPRNYSTQIPTEITPIANNSINTNNTNINNNNTSMDNNNSSSSSSNGITEGKNEKHARFAKEDTYEIIDNMHLDFDEMDNQPQANKNEASLIDLKQIKEEPSEHINKNLIKAEPRDPDLQEWELADAKMNDAITDIVNVKEESASVNVFDDDNNLNFWWYDAFEHRDRGFVYLFGKVLNRDTNKYNSCCVIVQNIERNVFVLPRTYKVDGKGNATDEKVEFGDLYNEFSEICTKNQIKKFASKPTTRKYAFEIPGVPQEAEYLKVVYNYNEPALPKDLSGETFSHIFGAQTGPLEHFLIKRDIMGPCWLQVKNAQINNSKESWCKIEFIVTNPKDCNPMKDPPAEIPPLVIMSLNLRTVLNKQKNINEIVAVSGLVCNQVNIDEPTPIEDQQKQRFTAIRQLSNTPYPPGFQDLVNKERKQSKTVIQLERTEASLLNYLLARVHICDPDVIVGHNFTGFDLDVLLHRMKALGTQHWHRLGRLKRKTWPKLQSGAGGTGEATFQERMIMCGRLICDTYLASKDLIRSKSYRMTELAKSQLKIEREDIEFDKIADYYHDAKNLLHMVKHNSFDTYLSMALMFKLQILPLTKQLTNLAGNLWARTMTGARAERNEFLLLHEFHRQKYICPDKSAMFKSKEAVDAIEIDGDNDAEKVKTKSKGRRKPAYSGGLVLEPKKGFYDKYVLLLDFNSLYPSIIQEYNICFTTVKRDLTNEKSKDDEDNTEEVPEVPDENLPQGILPKLLKTLVERRRQVKYMMKDSNISKTKMMQLDIRQKGLKLTANSMYGCLGFSHSRFFAKPLAMLITHKGREILQNTVDLAGKLNLNVIYGDTDSIMVYTNENELDKVKEMGLLLKKKVNEHYNLLEIDIDGFFKHMLLLKKKKYAALLIEEKPNGELVETVETKGLDLVRRDWCDLSHDVSSHVLELILSNMEREEVVEKIHTYLRDVADQIRRNDIPLEKYVINKQLTKRPEDYNDAKSQPHVQVALRMRQAGLPVHSGDTIPFVICKIDDGAFGSKGYAEKAFHFNDVKNGDKELDLEWYLTQQVHPPVGRLCSPIDGTDLGMLAECLGLDGSKFVRVSAEGNDDYTTLDSQISDEVRFKDCERLNIRCRSCQSLTLINGIVRENRDGDDGNIAEKILEYGFSCSNCHQMFPVKSVRVQITTAIRNFIKKYYEGWMICDDATCGNRTRMMSVFGRRCLIDGCHGAVVREYTDKQLYSQLLYLSRLCDPDVSRKFYLSSTNSIQIASLINQNQSALRSYKEVADNYLERSAYRHVDFSFLYNI